MTAARVSVVETVPELAGLRMVVRSEFRHLCPFRQEVDDGRITVAWTTAGATFELHALRAFLDQFRDVVISHEYLTATVRELLGLAEGVEGLDVLTEWGTAGMGVSCSTSPILAGRP